MIRAIGGLAVLAALAAAPAAHAGDEKKEAIAVPFKSERLATAAGRAGLKDEAAKRIDAYCRANPIEGTVANCRAFLNSRAEQAIGDKAVEYAARQQDIRLSQRPRQAQTGR